MVEALSCPSCGKPVARSLLQAGYRNCHHCGAKLTPETPPTPAKADPIRRPTSETGIIGSSPQWQEPQPGELRSRGESSSDVLRPVVRRRNRVEPVGDEKPVNLAEHQIAGPAPAARVAPKPFAGSKPAVQEAEPPTAELDVPMAEIPSGGPSGGASGTSVRSIRIVRKSSAGSGWIAPLCVVLGFALTLAAVVVVLLKSK